ncbi:MAG: hypothetical protein OQK32_04365, partial [Gammaproteobacteria bacterium]|nr:hypothetical protein [Gammaproteobacteria bacterium]
VISRIGYDDSDDEVEISYGSFSDNHITITSTGNVGIGKTGGGAQLDIDSTWKQGISSIGADAQALDEDSKQIYFLTGDGTDDYVTLPDITANIVGRIYRFINNDVGNDDIVIFPAGGDSIDGGASVTIANRYNTVTLVARSTAGDWFIINSK